MNVLHISNRSKVSATASDPQDTEALAYARQQRAGGVAALYIAAAYLVAMPYFLIVSDYKDLVDPAQKVTALVANQNSMYVMYLASYVVLGIVLAALALALWKRLAGSPGIAAVGGAVGLIWACMLVASGLVFQLRRGDRDRAPCHEPGSSRLGMAGDRAGGRCSQFRARRASRRSLGPARQPGGAANRRSAQGPELARDPDRTCGDRLGRSASAGRRVRLRPSRDRLAHLAGHCHASHQSV
jgi:hypothetical protein